MIILRFIAIFALLIVATELPKIVKAIRERDIATIIGYLLTIGVLVFLVRL